MADNFDTERYCSTLDRLDRTKAIRAIQQAYLQLAALTAYTETGAYDNRPAMNALLACLRDAGHPAGDDYPTDESDDPEGDQSAWIRAYAMPR